MWSTALDRQLDQAEPDWGAQDPYADAEAMYHRDVAVTLSSHALALTAGGLAVGGSGRL